MNGTKKTLINDIMRRTYFTEKYLKALSLENLAELVDYISESPNLPRFHSSKEKAITPVQQFEGRDPTSEGTENV